MSVSDLILKNLEISAEKKTTKKKSEQKKEITIPEPPRDYSPMESLNRINIEKGKRDIKIKDITIARLAGEVVVREEINAIWGKIYRSASYFGDFPSRYSGEFAAALGVSDPEKIQQLERVMAEAVELFMADFAESVAGAIGDG